MFNERIKELRLSYGLNQVEFGRKLGVTKQSVSNWENNNIAPSIDMLISIANKFSVSTDYLLGLDNKRHLYVDGLTDKQIFHLQEIINYICK